MKVKLGIIGLGRMGRKHAELQDFADRIFEDRQPFVGLEDGYMAVEWAHAAKKTVKED